MKRPLLCACICLITFISIWMYFNDVPPFYEDIPINEGERIIITGQIYEKEHRSYYGTEQTNLFLKSIKIINSDTGQVSDLNPKFNIICELSNEQNYSEQFVSASENELQGEQMPQGEASLLGEQGLQGGTALQGMQEPQGGTALQGTQEPHGEIALQGEQGRQEEPELGRFIRVSGTWQFYEHASNPGEFDLADYYATLNIVGKLEDGNVEALGKTYWKLRERLSQLRIFLKHRLYEALPEKEASILAKMLLGEKSGLDQEVKALYQRNGIVHILSISGLHITMIGMGLYRLLRKCGCPTIPAAVFGVVSLWLYGAMTGFGVSTVRAIGMYLIHMLGIILGRSYDLLTAAGILMAVMVCENPRLIYHSGFLLSFGSVSAVGCLYPILPVQDVATRKMALPPTFPVRFLLKRCGGMIQGLWLSTSISIFTLPITLYFFYEVPVYSAFVNLLILPFMGMVMVLGFLLMAVPDVPFMAELEHIILSGYERVCRLFEQLPAHTWIAGRPELWQIAVYYAGLLGIIWLCSGSSEGDTMAGSSGELNRRSTGMRNHGIAIKRCSAVMKRCSVDMWICTKIKRYIKRSKWWSLCIVLLVWFLSADFIRKDTISFLDVGQGDCIVVMTKTGKTYLFDGGSSSERTVGEDIILPFLKYHGISGVDGVFLSHPDKDHMNGILELLKQDMVEIERLYLPDVHEDCRADLQEILDTVTDQQVIYYAAGDYLRDGELLMTCLHPQEDFFGETNAYSGSFLLESGGLRVLLTGDVEDEGEVLLAEQLQKKQIGSVQVLKVAHHGSRYSTSAAFLEALHVDVAVISCGEQNSYGHPHEETLDRLKTAGASCCITWETGCVTVTEDGYYYFNKWKED